MINKLGYAQFPTILNDKAGGYTIPDEDVLKIIDIYNKSKTKLFIGHFLDDEEEFGEYFGLVSVHIISGWLYIVSGAVANIDNDSIGFHVARINLSTLESILDIRYFTFL